MDEVRRELDRLRRAWASARGRRLLGRAYLALLALLAVLAFASRLFGPWPPFASLEHRVLPVLALAAALWLLWPFLARLAPLVGRPSPQAIARRLDDLREWRDAADAALGLEAAAGALKPVPAFLAAQTAGRLRELDVRALAPPRALGERPRRIGRSILIGAFAFALLAPGVDGWLGRPGGGRGEEGSLTGADGHPDEEALDANRWLEAHARLRLSVPDPLADPLVLRARLRTDRPLPADYDGELVLLWDGEAVAGLATLAVPRGDEARETWPVDLRDVEALADRLTPGEHVAQVHLVPRRDPFTAALESNEVVVRIQSGGGGGGGDAPPRPAPQPTSEDEEETDPPPQPVPEGEEEKPPEVPQGPEQIEVVDPFVRGDQRVEKEDAIVAVPDDDAGLEPPPPVPLAEALRDFERVVERAMRSERIGPADRGFLRRYFEALRDSVREGEER